MNEVICSSDKPAYEYLKKWIAKLIYCKTKMKTCIYLKGTQGAGKSSLSNFLLEMVGEWNGHKTQSVVLHGASSARSTGAKVSLLVILLRCSCGKPS